ncbi:ABC transporter substrate-binding protein [Stieleria sp. JC731]|uniref:ABC transporter substrate-binding protein n=1 Tax=Stieleria sp. JC731 TaxID=2894195 RepID=UPI001E5E0516|nr:ABC transporter substrate-binding protein [Stieleria sp. JC731]MCC9603923.1 ABC transporter substrate-binding protein [Stieleria sp. JC731]
MLRTRLPHWCLCSIAVFFLAMPGCSRKGATPGNSVNVQLNWYPESEHGGLYQALTEGFYKDAGLEVSIQPGGRATPVGPELELGRAQFAIANADDVVIFRAQGLDVVAVMAAMQNHPRCIIARQDSGVEGFDDLAGKTFQRQAGRAFVEFLRAKKYLENVQEVPYHGSIASMVADPNVVIQGYSCAEPLLAKQQGIEVNTLMVSDLGFNPYSSVLVTTGKLIRENPAMVQTFVDATREGWKRYLTDGAKGNKLILSINEQGMTEEALQFGAESMVDLAMPNDASIDTVGSMTSERWQTLYEQLVELKVVESDKVKADECFTLQFLKD